MDLRGHLFPQQKGLEQLPRLYLLGSLVSHISQRPWSALSPCAHSCCPEEPIAVPCEGWVLWGKASLEQVCLSACTERHGSVRGPMKPLVRTPTVRKNSPQKAVRAAFPL